MYILQQHHVPALQMSMMLCHMAAQARGNLLTFRAGH